ncbi:MAG: hypothetical protein HKL90_05895 [Elusimicrobia bacterium]|nr:hypothetical protein [Elusimicrobiota bacterium]
MNNLVRRLLAAAVAAALATGSWPAAAFADGGAPSVSPAQALQQMKSWGVYQGDGDVLKSYLGNGHQLTPIGQAIYDALAPRDNPADAAAALQPSLDVLRGNGAYTPTSAAAASKLIGTVQKQLAGLPAPADPAAASAEDEFRRGALAQAALSGAAVVDPPNAASMVRVQTPDGAEFYDKKGDLVYVMNAGQTTVYNRALQKQQHAMNQAPQVGAPFVPETGRYNRQMFDYSYAAVDNQYNALMDGLRRDRMIELADLLGKTGQYRDDMWFTDKTLEGDLIAQAQKKTYDSGGKTYSVYDIVEQHFLKRKNYLKDAYNDIAAYKGDVAALLGSMSKNPVVSDGAVKSLALDEQVARVALTRAVLETQEYYVKNQEDRLDPSSPDSKQLMDALDKLNVPVKMKVLYKQRGRDMIAQLQQVRAQLDRVRLLLDKTDPSASLDTANAMLTASQTSLGTISTDYSVYVEVPTVAALTQDQTNVGVVDKAAAWAAKKMGGQAAGMNWSYWLYGRVDGGYRANMNTLAADTPKFQAIMGQIAGGDMAGARRSVIAMNPDAASAHFQSALFGDQPKRVTDDVKIAASLTANRDRIVSVFEKNKWIDTGRSLVEWSVAIGLGGGVAARGLTGLAKGLDATGLTAAGEDAGVMRRVLTRASIMTREAALHTAARLTTLQTQTSMAMTGRIENGAVRYLAESGVRALNAAARQTTFTAMSSGISGGFMLGQHFYQDVTGGHSVYTSDLSGAGQALWAGAKGGAWWANESWHPMLNYVGVPSSAFAGTRLAGAMDVLGSRGVVDTAWSGLGGLASWVMPTAVKLAGEDSALAGAMTQANSVLWPAVEGGAGKGLIDRLAEQGVAGKIAAFPLSMADNVAKYALVSDAASGLGHWVAYNAPSLSLPFVGQVTWGSSPDVETRIKGANQTGQELMQAPIWLALPTFSAHAALEAAPFMGGAEGMRQYDAAGRTHEYANAESGKELPFLETPKTPISQRVFDFHFFRDPPNGKWTVTEQVRRQGIEKTMFEAAGGKKADPLVFQSITKMADGELFARSLKVNDEVRLLAHNNFIRALLSDPARAKAILEAKPGEMVDGVGRVTPEIQRDVAVALYSSDIQIGKAMPRGLAASVDKVLKPYLEANLITREPARELDAALRRLKPRDAFSGDNGVLAKIRDEVSEWRVKQEPEGVGYKDYLEGLRSRVKQWEADGTLTPPEADVLAKLADYVSAIDKRFNSFNSVEKAYALADESLQALITEFRSRPAPSSLLTSFQSKLQDWKKGRRPDETVAGKGADGSFGRLISGLREDLQSAEGLTPDERAKIGRSIDDMEASPWALHDAKGTALKGWRPEQFEALMSALTAFVARRPTGSVRVFQMLKTGGGKTFVAFEGLLPLVEADAQATGKKVAFLTVQSNLEAQARMDFIAYKKIGSKLTFETYESLKTKAAEGKTKGRSALRDYWILGDEMDGAAMQPALTIGQVSGRVSRLSPFYARADALDLSVQSRIDSAASSLGMRAQTAAGRAQLLAAKVPGLDAEAVKAGFDRLDGAAGRLAQADGPLDRFQAESDVRDAAAQLQGLLTSPSASGLDAQALAQARGALSDVAASLDAPADDASLRGGVLDQLKGNLRRESNLLDLGGGQEGLQRLTSDAAVRSAELGARIDSLTAQADAAEGSSAPGASGRAQALRDEASLLGLQKAMTDRFQAVDVGRRLSGLQDRVAAAEAGPEARRPASLADWKAKAADLENALPAELKPVARERAVALARIYDIGRRTAQIDDALVAARRDGGSTAELEARRQSLESDYSAVRAEESRLKSELGRGSEGGDLGGLLRRIETLPREGPGARERARLVDKARAEVRRGLSQAGDEIAAIVREGKRGWEDRARRLMEERRALLKSFAGDENPMYAVFRRMKDDAQTFAMSEMLRGQEKSGRREVFDAAGNRMVSKEFGYEKVQKAFEAKLDGKSLGPWKTAGLLWDVLRGRPIDVPLEDLGLTRLRASQLLQALFREPTMPGLQADGLFWNLLSSIVNPKGLGGRGSWVRLELKRQLDGFFEDPAGIRLDNRTGRINVVHNGQWFESMDNETRRYWELAYGTDLTLPYTHQSISTIKDLTTDKETNFISFSGTAGDKLREHFQKNDIMMVGQGSTPPPNVGVELTARPIDSYARIGRALADLDSARGQVVVPDLKRAPLEVREAMVDRAGGALPKPVELRLDAFAGEGAAADRAWLERNGRTAGDGAVTLGDVKGAPEDVRLAALDAMSGPATLTLADFAKQAEGARNDPRAGVYAKALGQLRELRAGTGDADGVVLRVNADGAVPADDIPADVRPAIDAYLTNPKFKGKDSVVVRVSDVHGKTDADTAAARQWLLDLRRTVSVNTADIPEGARPALEQYLSAPRYKGVKTPVVRVADVRAGDGVSQAQAEAARAWLRTQPDSQESGLMVLSVSDTRVLKTVRDYLIRVKGLKPDEISMVFSDTEYLRNNVPEARVAEQMNLAALDTGRARVLILDTRVGGRGLDLNFKGQRGSAVPEAFRGYTDFEMLIVDPHKMSSVHLLQAEGRIDVGRVLPNADRTFSLVMDMDSVAGYRVFRDMLAQDPFFKQLRADPRFVAFVKARGGAPDWAACDAYVRLRAAQGGDEGAALAADYAAAVKKALDIQQAQVEEGQLRSSSVLNDGRPTTNGQFPGVEGLK